MPPHRKIEKSGESRKLFVAAMIVIQVLTAALVVYSHAVFGVSFSWTLENGFLELVQQALLVAAGILFAASIFSHAKQEPSSVRTLIFSGLCFTFLLRESDVAEPDRIAWLSFWLDENGKALLLIVGWICVLCYTVSFWPWPEMVRSTILFDVTFWLLALAAVFLSVSWGIDRDHLDVSNGLLVEEASEVLAYGAMVLAALLLFSRKQLDPSQTNGVVEVPSA